MPNGLTKHWRSGRYLMVAINEGGTPPATFNCALWLGVVPTWLYLAVSIFGTWRRIRLGRPPWARRNAGGEQDA